MTARRRKHESPRRQRAPAPEPTACPLATASSNPCAVTERGDVAAPSPAASSIGALPVDAVYEILLRLPAKLLCRLRTVCRPWRSLLSDPHFAVAHVARHPGPLIVAGYAENEGNDVIVNIMDLSGQIVKRVRRVQGSDRVMSIELGLVFVKNVDSGSYKFLFPATGDLYRLCHYRFLNPATGAVYHLPDGFAEEHVAFGVNLIREPKFILGQVPSTGEYKVLKLMYHFSLRLTCQLLEVCTLNSSSLSGWRRKEVPGDGVAFCKLTRLVVDGIVYLLCSATHHSITFKGQVIEKDLIITFELKTEAWGPRIRGPPISFSNNAVQIFDNIGLPKVKQLTLAYLNGSLVVVHGPAPYMDFWILTDFDKGVWVKQYSMQFEQYGLLMPVHPLLVLGDGRVVIHKEDDGYLQIYEPSTNTFTNSVGWTRYSAISMYAGNLLSLDQ